MKGRHLGPMPAAGATVRDTGRGTEVELTPTDPAELGALREHVRAHAERMAAGQCWMWQDRDRPRGP